MDLQTAISNRKIFTIKSIFDWINFNGGNTHIGVFCQDPNLVVPKEYINSDNTIVLSLNYDSCSNIVFDNQKNEITFSSSFSGKIMNIVVPVNVIFGIWEKNNGVGEKFSVLIKDNHPTDEGVKKSKTPHLTIVK